MYLVKLKGYKTILCDFLKTLVPLWKSIDPERTGANRKKPGQNGTVRNEPKRTGMNQNEPERSGLSSLSKNIYVYLHLII